MFNSTQGQYSNTPTKSGGALIDSSESEEHSSADGQSSHANKAAKSKPKSHASTGGIRPKAPSQVSQVAQASRDAAQSGQSLVTLFQEWHEPSKFEHPRTLAKLFSHWDIPDGVGIVKDVRTGAVSHRPVITNRLVGGEEAARDMWELVHLLGKEGSIFHSASVATGNYWEVLEQAEMIIEGLGINSDCFKSMYRKVEEGPLNHHFTGYLGKPLSWDFASIRAARAETPSRGPGEFFEFLTQGLASLVLDVQQTANGELRPATRRQMEENFTAGKLAPKRGQEGPWCVMREARVILRRIGTAVPDLDPTRPDSVVDEDLSGWTHDELRLALYMSPSVVQLAKELLIIVGLEMTAFGVRCTEERDQDSKDPACKLTFALLAHAATMVESELLTLHNIPRHHGQSRVDAQIHQNYSAEEVLMLAEHRKSLEGFQAEAERCPGGRLTPLIEIIREINVDFRLYRIDYTNVFPSCDPVRV